MNTIHRIHHLISILAAAHRPVIGLAGRAAAAMMGL